MKELSVEIEGMSCNECVGRVSGALQKLRGVFVRKVGVGRAECTLEGDSPAARADVINAIVGLGFSVTASNLKTP